MKIITRAILLLLLAITVIAGTACALSQSGRQLAAPYTPPPNIPPTPALTPPPVEPSTWDSAMSAGKSLAAESVGDSGASDRKIVRNGSMTMEVADIAKSQSAIAGIANQFEGYVVSSTQRADSDQPSGYISIRIPVAKFDDAMQKLRALAVKVTYENTNSQDVTEQYADLQAQLHNQEATEAQYLELLKKAEKVQDILDVQRELSNVRGTIERLKGRIQYLDRTSDMAIIEVSLVKSKPIGESSWDVAGIFKSAVDGLIIFGKALLSLLIWVVVFSPIWIIILAIVLIVRWRVKKAKARSGA